MQLACQTIYLLQSHKHEDSSIMSIEVMGVHGLETNALQTWSPTSLTDLNSIGHFLFFDNIGIHVLAKCLWVACILFKVLIKTNLSRDQQHEMIRMIRYHLKLLVLPHNMNLIIYNVGINTQCVTTLNFLCSNLNITGTSLLQLSVHEFAQLLAD